MTTVKRPPEAMGLEAHRVVTDTGEQVVREHHTGVAFGLGSLPFGFFFEYRCGEGGGVGFASARIRCAHAPPGVVSGCDLCRTLLADETLTTGRNVR